ncbi:MAG: hypothetical protein ACI9YH_000761 [Colwellia sp.]|jgi:hypothetical protein
MSKIPKQKDRPTQTNKRPEPDIETEQMRNAVINNVVDVMWNKYGADLKKSAYQMPLAIQRSKADKACSNMHHIKPEQCVHYLSLVTGV